MCTCDYLFIISWLSICVTPVHTLTNSSVQYYLVKSRSQTRLASTILFHHKYRLFQTIKQRVLNRFRAWFFEVLGLSVQRISFHFITVLRDIQRDDNKFHTQLSGITSSLKFDRQPLVHPANRVSNFISLTNRLAIQTKDDKQSCTYWLNHTITYTKAFKRLSLHAQNVLRCETIELPQVFAQDNVLAW